MLFTASLALSLASATVAYPSGRADTTAGAIARSSSDTSGIASSDTIKPRVRPRAIELSDWYYRRLQIHRWGSYVVFPVFAFQYAAGNRLFPDPANAPTWAKTGHRAGATVLAAVFTSNTITGAWNLWDSRDIQDRRTLRYVHALSMLSADAAFTYAGATLSTQAENSLQKRREHRTVAISAMGVTAASALMMKVLNSRPSR